MFFNWRGVAIVLTVIAAIICLCAVDLRCSGAPASGSTVAHVKGEVAEGRKAMRQQEAESLARVARDLRVLAKRYKANGENKKAQRAIGAAQELDKKIVRLLGEE